MPPIVANLIDQFFWPPASEARNTLFCRQKWIFKQRIHYSGAENRVGKRAIMYSCVENEFSSEENIILSSKIELEAEKYIIPSLKIEFWRKKTVFWA